MFWLVRINVDEILLLLKLFLFSIDLRVVRRLLGITNQQIYQKTLRNSVYFENNNNPYDFFFTSF